MTNPESTTGDGRLDALAKALGRHMSGLGGEILAAPGELTLVIPADSWPQVALILRDHKDLAFAQLIDVCGIDFAAFGQAEWETVAASSTGFGRGANRDLDLAADDPHRFAAIYHLLSLTHNRRLRVRVYAEPDAMGGQPMVDSMVDVWPAANWFEREAFDLYGILFRGHPDLRRILTDYGFVGHPFRKDFPLSGHVEMRYDAQTGRVVYEPVSIEPRILVPKVIRADSRYANPQRTDAPHRMDA